MQIEQGFSSFFAIFDDFSKARTGWISLSPFFILFLIKIKIYLQGLRRRRHFTTPTTGDDEFSNLSWSEDSNSSFEIDEQKDEEGFDEAGIHVDDERFKVKVHILQKVEEGSDETGIHVDDEKPHKCPYCTRRFIQRYNMKQHIKTHRIVQSGKYLHSGPEN